MNLRIRRLSGVLSVLYLVLFLQLNRVQFFGAERLQDDVNNTRGLIREFGRARGPIITADGVLVARSVEYDGSVDFRREYPEGELYAHITGYQSLNVEAVGLGLRNFQSRRSKQSFSLFAIERNRSRQE